MRAALAGSGWWRRSVEALEYDRATRVWRATLGSAEEAAAAAAELEAAPPPALGEGATACRWYSDRPVSERGWCVLEVAASREMAARLAAFPQLAPTLARLPAKLVEVGGDAPTVIEQGVLDAEEAPRIARVQQALTDSTQSHFTYGADRQRAALLFDQLVAKIGSTAAQAGDALGGPGHGPGACPGDGVSR